MGEVYAHTPTYLPLVDKGDTASPLLVLVTSVASFNCLPMMAAPVAWISDLMVYSELHPDTIAEEATSP